MSLLILSEQLRLPIQLMLKLAVKPSIAWKRKSLFTYSSSPGKQRYYCQNCHSQIFTIQENIPEVCALKLGTIDECDQNLQTVPKRHIFKIQPFLVA